jgi:FkbM family methyltransferase
VNAVNLVHTDPITPQLLEDAAAAIKLYAEIMGPRTLIGKIDDLPLHGAKVLDIGAHHGTFGLSALDAGAMHVVCVEACSDNYRFLLRNLFANDLPWWKAVPIHAAAWEGPEDVLSLRAVTGSDGNSGQFSLMFDGRFPTTEHVPTLSFTALLESRAYDLERWDYVKVDVEGAEWSWLSGPDAAKAALRHTRFLDIELHPLDNREYFTPPEGRVLQLADVDQWFREAGAKIYWHESMPTRLAIVAP